MKIHLPLRLRNIKQTSVSLRLIRLSNVSLCLTLPIFSLFLLCLLVKVQVVRQIHRLGFLFWFLVTIVRVDLVLIILSLKFINYRFILFKRTPAWETFLYVLKNFFWHDRGEWAWWWGWGSGRGGGWIGNLIDSIIHMAMEGNLELFAYSLHTERWRFAYRIQYLWGFSNFGEPANVGMHVYPHVAMTVWYRTT